MGGSCQECSSPLKIVLGSLATESPSLLSNHGPSSSSTSSSPTYILGTSYYATPRLTGTASTTSRSALKLNKDGRVPMEDRKAPFDHYRPRSLLLSTIRVTTINISSTLSTYFSDQLHSEQKNESLVDAGKLTPSQMDDINEAWERREWQERMVNNLPKKIGWALLRYHACTGIMRFYEFILGRFVLRVDVVPIEVGGSTTNTPTSVPSSSSSAMTQEQAITIMDKLTRDPFQSSLRTSQLLHNQENFLGKVISSDGMTETSTSRELMRRMFSTCIWANIIPFLAELTVQQGVLVYGYGIYYLEKKRRRRAREEAGKKLGRDLELIEEEKEEVDGSDEEKDGGKDAEEDVNESAYALSLLVQSTRLSIVKGCSWITASAGGAVGSALYPGWGTVFGIQIGDTMVGALID